MTTHRRDPDAAAHALLPFDQARERAIEFIGEMFDAPNADTHDPVYKRFTASGITRGLAIAYGMDDEQLTDELQAAYLAYKARRRKAAN